MSGSLSLEDWSEEKCIKLISEFRRRSVLWDKTYIHYYRKEVKWSAWEDIAKVMNVTADCCRHKMGILLSSFRREKAKMMNSMKLGDLSKVYRSIWFGWPHLLFLIDNTTNRERQTQCQASTDSDDAHEIIVQIISSEDHECGEGDKSSDEYTAQTVPKKRNALVLNKDYQPNVARKQARICANSCTSSGPSRQVRVPCRSEISDDELTFFSTFLASKMRKYSEVTKNAVQEEICNIIFKADKNIIHSFKYEAHSDSIQKETSEDLSDALIDPEDIKISYSDSE